MLTALTLTLATAAGATTGPDPQAVLAKVKQAVFHRLVLPGEQIRYHDRKYYVEAAPEISDREYDQQDVFRSRLPHHQST